MMTSQSHNPRRMLPPGTSTRKRKQPESAHKPDKPMPSNTLLAGYLAHEFLTKGTLLGKKFNPNTDRADIDTDTDSINNSAVDNSTAEQTKRQDSRAETSDVEPAGPSLRKEHETYGEVANIVKMDGTHIKGIVNPTQLSQWIRM